jgi:hypothetical protein
MATDTLPGIFTKAYWSNLYNYFFTALKLDKEDKATSTSTGVPVPNPNGNIKNWFKTFGLGLVVLGFTILGFWSIVRSRPHNSPIKRSHHGYNQFGERY